MASAEISRELVERLRNGLADRGAVGRFLLDQIDAALASGIEERQEPLRKGPRPEWEDGGIVRRAPSDAETLKIHLDVLRAYFVDAPRVAQAGSSFLREHFDIEEVVLALDPDLDMEPLIESRVSVVPLHLLAQAPGEQTIGRAVTHLISLVEGKSDLPSGDDA
jgi:hypothetical protein